MLSSQKYRDIHYYLLILLVVSIPFSTFLMSTTQIFLVINWLLSPRLVTRLNSFASNTPALMMFLFYFFLVLGLTYSSDLNYGFEDLKKKLPMLILPLIVASTRPLNARKLKYLLTFFISATFASTLYSLFIYWEIFEYKIDDVRNISVFVSHIRLSMMITLSVFIASFYFIKESGFSKNLYLIPIGTFLYFLFVINSITGLGLILSVLTVLFVNYLYYLEDFKRKIVGLSSLLLLGLTLVTLLFIEFQKIHNTPNIDWSQKEQFSKNGGKYFTDTTSQLTENGNLVWAFIVDQELQKEWDKVSDFEYYGYDSKGNLLRETLIRYMTSKGLKKDKEGFAQLTSVDITAIERSISNYKFLVQNTYLTRVQQTLWEVSSFLKGANPNGHSLTMRFEFWKAAINLIKENPLFGVGVGDVNIKMKEQYVKMNSPLDSKWRLRAHNQYLSIGVASGVLGMCFFVIVLIFPFFVNIRSHRFFYIVFFIISIISMLSEDLLETQAGVTFFMFFWSLFLFGYRENIIVESSINKNKTAVFNN